MTTFAAAVDQHVEPFYRIKISDASYNEAVSGLDLDHERNSPLLQSVSDGDDLLRREDIA